MLRKASAKQFNVGPFTAGASFTVAPTLNADASEEQRSLNAAGVKRIAR